MAAALRLRVRLGHFFRIFSSFTLDPLFIANCDNNAMEMHATLSLERYSPDHASPAAMSHLRRPLHQVHPRFTNARLPP